MIKLKNQKKTIIKNSLIEFLTGRRSIEKSEVDLFSGNFPCKTKFSTFEDNSVIKDESTERTVAL